MADSFVFYRSFYEALKYLDAPTRLKAYDAVCKYALNGEMPDTDGMEMAVFELIRPQIDANERRRASGKAGGRATQAKNKRQSSEIQARAKQVPSKLQASDKQSESTVKANVNVNVNVNDNKECNADRDAVIEKFNEFWELYPRKKNEDATCRTWISMHYDMETVEKILAALRLNIAKNGAWKRDGGRYIPNPEKWLLDRMWRDEVYEDKEDQKKTQFQSFDQREYSESQFMDLERKKMGVTKIS